MDETTAPVSAPVEPVDVDTANTFVNAIKAGWKTSELWVTIIVVGSGVALTAGLIGDNSAIAKVAGAVMSTVKGVAYVWSRTQLKKAA